MKAISIKQPWASLICGKSGIKTIEIRSWFPKSISLPFRLGIVSSLKDSNIVPTYGGSAVYPSAPWPRGVLLGSVKVSGIRKYCSFDHFNNDQLKHLNPDECFVSGIYGWLFEDLALLPKPMPVTGRLRLFDIPDSLIREWVGGDL